MDKLTSSASGTPEWPSKEWLEERKNRWPASCPYCLVRLCEIPRWEEAAAEGLLHVVARHTHCDHIITFDNASSFFQYIRKT